MRRKWNQRAEGPRPWATFLAWCPEPARYDALTRALVALVGAEGTCSVSGENHEEHYLPPTKATALVRHRYEKYGICGAEIEFAAPSGRQIVLLVEVRKDRKHEDLFRILEDGAVLQISLLYKGFEEGYLLPDKLMRFKGIVMKPGFDASMAWLPALRDSVEILTRFCTSHPAITTGCCVEGPDWCTPITSAGTYHMDGYPGRDLALSWMHLHDKAPLHFAAGWTMDALRERVEASPPHSSVWIIDEDRLSREQTLAALDLPPKTLVESLEAAANKLHPEWEAIQWKLAEYMQMLLEAPEIEKEMIPVSEEHIHFIEEYTPAYVRHLDNKALVLHAHPDRTLWPLWSSALDLLGIRPQS